jgi:diphthamide biosynthesis protein 2
MATPAVAPVLSTPDTHIFEADTTLAVDPNSLPHLTDSELAVRYEIKRTVEEIRQGRHKRIALQFPDEMLVHAPRVFDALGRALTTWRKKDSKVTKGPGAERDESAEVADAVEQLSVKETAGEGRPYQEEETLFILGDTSYGACCVDEVAAEHVDADVVVHYGRSCLSPTARLPVIYVFTCRDLNLGMVMQTFALTFPDKDKKIVLMADIPYVSHISTLHDRLRQEGYSEVYATEVVSDSASPLPNRTVPARVKEDVERLRDYELFHIADPPPALLLTLSSRVGAIHIYPTDHVGAEPPKALLASSVMTLRRRYALLTSLSSASVFGILVNTLSVKNYLHILDHVKEQIEAAGKKSYTFVVGKINAAKVANFSEVGGWVVIGCWESSLIESKDFWKPIITPFELTLALKGDSERVWTGEWSSDFQAILIDDQQTGGKARTEDMTHDSRLAKEEVGHGDYGSDEESAPPEFDLRTGRYVSHSRPMLGSRATKGSDGDSTSKSLIKRGNGEIAQIGGVISPGAEFLRSQRTWQGLGSDFEVSYEQDGERGAVLEEGRSGHASGYVVGDDRSKT